LISPNAVVPNNLIWLRFIFVESRGLYKRTNTEVATSGCDSVTRIYVKPAVGTGGQTGVRGPLFSREISSATADGHAVKHIYILENLLFNSSITDDTYSISINIQWRP